MSALLEETLGSQERMIQIAANRIAAEPRGVLFNIKEHKDHFSLIIDHVCDGERDKVVDETEPVSDRHSLVTLVVKILQNAMSIQYRGNGSSSTICITDVTRVTTKLEMSNEAQLKFYH